MSVKILSVIWSPCITLNKCLGASPPAAIAYDSFGISASAVIATSQSQIGTNCNGKEQIKSVTFHGFLKYYFFGTLRHLFRCTAKLSF